MIPTRAVTRASGRHPPIPSALRRVHLLELIDRARADPTKAAVATGRAPRASLSRPTYPGEALCRHPTRAHLACHVIALGCHFPCLDCAMPLSIGVGPTWSADKRHPDKPLLTSASSCACCTPHPTHACPSLLCHTPTLATTAVPMPPVRAIGLPIGQLHPDHPNQLARL
jgi:hypothetical protein